MNDILYVKVEQHIPVTKKQITMKDLGTFYCNNKKVTQELEKEIFYTLTSDSQKKTMFTLTKVYEVIHRVYPNIQIVNLGERDFVIQYEEPKKKSKAIEITKTVFVCLIVFIGAAFTIMTFNEDINVSKLFDKTYEIIMGAKKSGASALEFCYCLGLPLGIMIFYNHFKKNDAANDPTPIQVEMRKYEEDVNKAVIHAASREDRTIDVN